MESPHFCQSDNNFISNVLFGYPVQITIYIILHMLIENRNKWKSAAKMGTGRVPIYLHDHFHTRANIVAKFKLCILICVSA